MAQSAAMVMFGQHRWVATRKVRAPMVLWIWEVTCGNGYMTPLSKWIRSTSTFRTTMPFPALRIQWVYLLPPQAIAVSAEVPGTGPMGTDVRLIVLGLEKRIPMMGSDSVVR